MASKPNPDTETDKSQSPKSSFTCPVCRHGFARQAKLDKHQLPKKCYRQGCGDSQVFLCSEALNVHQKRHREEGFACDHRGCTKVFKKMGKLNRHKVIHSSAKPYVCPEESCKRAYTRNEHLKRHMKSHGEKEYRCDKCNFECYTNEKLRRHQKTHEKQFACEHCAKTFAKRFNLLIHEYDHTGILPFECTEEGCSERFMSRTNRKKHLKLVHGKNLFSRNKPDKRVCGVEDCGEEFMRFSELQKHIKAEHKNAPEFTQCRVCFMCLDSSEQLRKHRRTHRDRVYCTYGGCKKSYAKKANLTIHINTRHLEIRPFKCTEGDCTQTFAQKQKLEYHIHAIHKKTETQKTVEQTARKKSRLIKQICGYTSVEIGDTDVDLSDCAA